VKLVESFPKREFTLFETEAWKGKDVVFTISFKSTQFKNRSRPINPTFVVNTSVCSVNVGAVDGNDK
jgi:type IV secretory pathway component VirB8